MKFRTLQYAAIIFLIIAFPCGGEDEEEEASISDAKEPSADPKQKVFKPTKEWQIVIPGQALPRGLHVRLNLQTREMQAKLYDDEDKPTSLIATESQEEKKYTTQELEDALKVVTNADEAQKEVHVGEFRSYEELKKDFDEMKLSVKTDTELLTELVKRFKSKETSEDQHTAILLDLELLVHQYDNARDFARMGGLKDVALVSLNHTSSEVRLRAAHLLGAAMQSNPVVQIAAFEAGVLRSLLLVLVSKTEKVEVRSAVIFAMSCLVRRFPIAQKSLVNEGGLPILALLFNSNGTDHQKLQVKVLTLLNDLVLEKRLTEGSDFERLRQYKAVGLEEKLQSQGWCELFSTLLPKVETESWKDQLEHDTVEKVLGAMSTFVDLCWGYFVQFMVTMRTLKRHYEKLAQEETDEDEYFSSMVELTSSVLKKLQAKDEL